MVGKRHFMFVAIMSTVFKVGGGQNMADRAENLHTIMFP